MDSDPPRDGGHHILVDLIFVSKVNILEVALKFLVVGWWVVVVVLNLRIAFSFAQAEQIPTNPENMHFRANFCSKMFKTFGEVGRVDRRVLVQTNFCPYLRYLDIMSYLFLWLSLVVISHSILRLYFM